MPEGDTLHKVAAYMRPRMSGTTLTQAAAKDLRLAALCDRQVADVRAQGKHLIVDIAAVPPVHGPAEAPVALVWHLRVHLGMFGSWHVYAAHEPWRRPRWQASLVLTTHTQQTFVCFNAQDVELLRPSEVYTTSILGRLGPNLLGPTCDFGVVLRRARRRGPGAPMVDTLLDQSVAAGLGNVYKSELLFLFQLHPQTRTDAVADATLHAIFSRGRALLQQNIGGWPRTTTYDRSLGPQRPGHTIPRLYVYRRRGAPCLHCQAPIVRATCGKHARSTYWCPTCQPDRAARPSLA